MTAPQPRTPYDLAVIGGGACGLAAARYAVSRGRSAVIIERGGTTGGHAAGYGCKAVASCAKCAACAARHDRNAAAGIPVLSGSAPAALAGTPGAFTLTTGGGITVSAGRVLVAAGFEPFDAARKGRFGAGRVPGVITGTDAGRMLAADGVLRAADGRVSRHTAFIQCVGSRDRTEGNAWCSRVCCAYALRMADMLCADPLNRVTVFYMDIQNFGRDFRAFRTRLAGRGNLRLVRCIPGRIDTGAGGCPVLAYEDAHGGMVSGQFDTVVLAVGITPRETTRELAACLGIAADGSGFLRSRSLREPYRSTRDGIYIAGTCRQPMGIAETMAEGEAAAAAALAAGEGA